MEAGLSANLLFSQVENTAPFLLRDEAFAELPYIQSLKGPSPKTAFEYYRYCLSAHYASVASFVPTDVDNLIRFKLWKAPLVETTQQAALVLESLKYDFQPVTTRGVAHDGEWMAGHHGEWFSVAVGAYCAHRKADPSLAATLRDAIAQEITREEKIFSGLRASKDGIGMLKAATIIAHNLGDLDRVMDQWELAPEDPLRKDFYKLGHENKRPAMRLAGEVNKAFMVNENHRHFALREPKSLRRNPDFLLPLGPFFDSWGSTLAKHPDLDTFELLEIIQALLEGSDRLERAKTPCQGYTRALAGIFAVRKNIVDELPAKTRKRLQTGALFAALQQSKERFEADWAKRALAMSG